MATPTLHISQLVFSLIYKLKTPRHWNLQTKWQKKRRSGIWLVWCVFFGLATLCGSYDAISRVWHLMLSIVRSNVRCDHCRCLIIIFSWERWRWFNFRFLVGSLISHSIFILFSASWNTWDLCFFS